MDTGHHVVPPLAAHGALRMDERALDAWGARMGRDAHAPLVITLTGDLGTGKTTLVRAICRGYGVTDSVTSPTYALVHEYTSPRSRVFHVDLYRLHDATELDGLGWEDLLAESALILVEWPERAAGRIPADHVPIALEYAPGDPGHRFLLAG